MVDGSKESGTAQLSPRMLHHTAYVTHDVEKTVDFYTNVMNMPLISTVVNDKVPSTGDDFPYIHLFFALDDGSTIAFFESLDLPRPAKSSHPAYDVFNHLALEAGSREEVDAWAKRLADHGIDYVGPVDHEIIYSIYFFDPNGIRIEMTTTTDDKWTAHADRAAQEVADWLEIKRKKASGESSADAMAYIMAKRGAHKIHN